MDHNGSGEERYYDLIPESILNLYFKGETDMAKNTKTKAPKKLTKVDRDEMIWNLHTAGMSVKDITAEVGCSESVVRYTIAILEEAGHRGLMADYFEMAHDLHFMLAQAGLDADNRIGNLMMALWAYSIVKKSKLKTWSQAKFDEFLGTRRMKRAGYGACDVLRQYRANLKALKN